ncbi:hypothetical protein KJ562_03035 [Patescibacteria group bacterium]|nr:hypothetical protein [Patescibacteria group bacterium]MBU4162148.1 hypothetical protein [Patescibacteria group bacterium]
MDKEKGSSTIFLGGISAILLAILLYQNFVPGALTFNNSTGVSGELTKDDAAQKAITYIEENLASPGTEFTLTGSDEKNGVYEIRFDVMGQNEKVYVTKDGKILFLNSFDMNPPEEKELTQTDKPEVGLFVMSFCPYGNQAEALMSPVAKLLGDKVDIQLHYILYSKDQGYNFPDYCYDKEEQYCSMHGIQELNQGIRELCVQKYQPDKLWNFIEAINDQATYQDVDSKWESIARGAGVDVDRIKRCELNEATDILAHESELTSQQYSVQNPASHKGLETDKIAGSPTIVINGIIYDGARGAEDYKNAICSAFNNAPDECSQIIDETGNAVDPGSCE